MSNVMLFDSHTHLQFSEFNDDRDEVIKRLIENDVRLVNIGTGLEDSAKAILLSNRFGGFMWATVGLHPTDAPNEGFDYGRYKGLALDPVVVAVGECGLDYFRTPDSDKNRQKDIFEKQVDLAKELGKPLMIHCRPKEGDDAYLDLIEILKSKNLNISTGNGTAHFFAGSKEAAKQFLDLGFYISFTGPITFPPKADQPRAGATQYKELVEYVPLEKILIETDAPFAAPAPYRGKRNEPLYVEFVARKIAEVKELSYEEVAYRTFENALKLFKLKF